mgnify:CR=1 FL=1
MLRLTDASSSYSYFHSCKSDDFVRKSMKFSDYWEELEVLCNKSIRTSNQCWISLVWFVSLKMNFVNNVHVSYWISFFFPRFVILSNVIRGKINNYNVINHKTQYFTRITKMKNHGSIPEKIYRISFVKLHIC